MFGLFKKDPSRKLQKKYDKLMEEFYHLSKTNRRLADKKYAEAEKVMQELEDLRNAG